MKDEISFYVGLALLSWSFAVTSTSVEAMRRALVRGRRTKRHAPVVEAARPEVVIVRPCAGDEPSLDRALGSIHEARASFTLHYRLALADAQDSALPAAQRAVEGLAARGIEAELVFTGAAAPNAKAAQLEASVEAAPWAEVVLVADSDVDLTDADLDALVAPLLGRAPAWACWAPPVEHAAPRTLGDRASAAVLGASLHAFPLLAGLDPRGLVGKLFAIRKDALAAIGGFGSLVDYLGEDMEIARRVRAAGGSVVVAPMVARSLATGRSFTAVVARFGRWLSVIRAQRPALLASYPALFFATGPIVLCSLLAAPLVGSLALFAAQLALVARLGVALFAARAAGRPAGILTALREVVLADVVLACAFARALRSRTITWRQRVLFVDRAGVLRQAAEAEP
jgi:ceramide glucosyltransferase